MTLRMSLSAVSAALLLLVPAVRAEAVPAQSKVDRALRASVDGGTERIQKVIITVNPGCRAAVKDALSRHGDVTVSEHEFINAIAGEIHNKDVDELAKSACVRLVSSDADVFADAVQLVTPTVATVTPNKKGAPDPAGPLVIGPAQTLSSSLRDTLGLPHVASQSPSVPTGSGIGIAVIDSGIAPSADFGKRIAAFYDFSKGLGRAVPAYDDYGHGTHIAGLIASSGVLSNYEFQGVAPDAHLVGLKVLDRTGQGKTSNVIRAIEFVLANRAALNVQVINLSLGHPIYAPAADDPLVQAVEKASAAGVVVVASGGNFGQKQSDPNSSGYAGITSPGNAPSAITVGAVMTNDTATRHDDQVAPYSSRGPTWFDAFVKPDVVAPGHRLASDTNISSYLYGLLTGNRSKSKNGEPLLLLSGSSMAAAVTTGVVALVLDAHDDLNGNGNNKRRPGLTPNLVKGILEYTAIKIPGADYLTQGAGEINAAGAIAVAGAIDTGVITGTWMPNLWPLSYIGGRLETWSQHILYGNVALSGSLLSAANIVWSSNIVWGTALDNEGDNIVWGTAVITEDDNIVWGTSRSGEEDNIVWGTNIVWSTRVIGQAVDGEGDNIVWGTNIVWGSLESDNIVWGTMSEEDNIVWGTAADAEGDNIVWGTLVVVSRIGGSR